MGWRKMEKKATFQKSVTITTTINREVYDKIKAAHLHYNELLITGFSATMKNPEVLDRIKGLEESSKQAMDKLAQLKLRIWELEIGTKVTQ
jgi:hypothetical protein